MPNVREALRWSITRGDATAGLRLVTMLAFFWWGDMRAAEGLSHIERLLAAADDLPSDLAQVAYGVAVDLSLQVRDGTRCERFIRAGLSLPEPDRPDSPFAHEMAMTRRAELEFWAAFMGLDDWRVHAEAGIALARKSGLRRELLGALSRTATLYAWRGIESWAHELFSEALALNHVARLVFHRNYGRFLAGCGDRAGSSEQFRQGLAAVNAIGFPAAIHETRLFMFRRLREWKQHAAVLGFAASSLGAASNRGLRGLARFLSARIAVTYRDLGETARAARYRAISDRVAGDILLGREVRNYRDFFRLRAVLAEIDSPEWTEMEESLDAELIAEERRNAAQVRTIDAALTAEADARRYGAEDPESAMWLAYLDPE